MHIISRSFFTKINKVTIAVTLFLIFVGGFVRSSGSGMGCPDWPKCFGRWIPPTVESQLPMDYADRFVVSRVEKNKRFANLLDKIGKHDLAEQVRKDVSVLEHEPFNSVKTWIEYVNRLIGAGLGILFLLTAIASCSYWRQYKRVTVLSIVNVFIVAFQGWLGSIVVSTNLMQWLVTAHMLLAIVLLTILVYNHFKIITLSFPKYLIGTSVFWENVLSIVSIGVLLFQIIIGTKIREDLDAIAKSAGYVFRDQWISQLGDIFEIHRAIAVLIFVLNILLVWRISKGLSKSKVFNWLSLIILGVLLIQLSSGALLSYFALPALIQPLHLLFSFMLYVVQFYLLLNLSYTKKLVQKY